LFGGVQVFQILIGIVRMKFVAVLLGTAGVGIIGLLNAPVQLIISITGLGIAVSAVRDISNAKGSDDETRFSRVVMTLRRWSWFTGLLGAVVTITMAPLLSTWSFGDKEYTWAFVWLSVTLLLKAISKAQTSILQGTRRLRDMARATVIGSAVGLVTSVPLYYFFGVKGIVPAMIITSVTALLLSWYYARKVEVSEIRMTASETFRSGLGIAKLGIYMTIAGFIATFSTYVLNAFISNRGSIDQVGLFNAGWGVVGQYTNLIFAAMATDYFPRLSAMQDDNRKMNELVKQQTETALLIMSPLLALLIISMPLVVRVLYTPAFLPMVMFASLTVLGTPFKAMSWAMGYVNLAKGSGRLFVILEVISGMLMLGLNLLFYHLYKLNGLGISYIISYLFGVLLVYVVLKSKYNITYGFRDIKRYIITYLLVAMSFSTVFIQDQFLRYGAGIVALIVITLYSLKVLNELMDIKSFIKSKFKK